VNQNPHVTVMSFERDVTVRVSHRPWASFAPTRRLAWGADTGNNVLTLAWPGISKLAFSPEEGFRVSRPRTALIRSFQKTIACT